MKYLFLAIAAALVGLSFVAAAMQPENTAKFPVIWWVTDANPARFEQIKLFGEWLAKNHYPPMEVRLDTSNGDEMKKIIQGVSGVAGDTMDVYDLQLFQAIGLMRNVDEDAKRLNYGLDRTYPALESLLMRPDKNGVMHQYLFPCNVFAPMYIVNREAFRRFGQPLPPARWTLEEFERLGKAYVKAANPPGSRRLFFFADGVELDSIRRSLGSSYFNETMTASALDETANIKTLKLFKKWTYEDHLIPSDVDRAQFSTASGYGGANPQLFNSDNYAMLNTGRHLLIVLRQFNEKRAERGEPLLDLGVSEPAHGGFPNTTTQTRALGVYAGGGHQDLAVYFQAFLASKEYNEQIVKDADSLPPNPAYTETEEYKHPADHPEEWDVHEPFAEAAKTLAVGREFSPFVLQSVVTREDNAARDKFMANEWTAEQAAAAAAARVNAEIQRTLSEDPSLLPRYRELVARQRKIDDLKAKGEKIPLEWIENPFHRAYYKFKGMVK